MVAIEQAALAATVPPAQPPQIKIQRQSRIPQLSASDALDSSMDGSGRDNKRKKESKCDMFDEVTVLLSEFLADCPNWFQPRTGGLDQ